MSDAAYTPREGSIPAQVIELLQGQPAGTWLTTEQIIEQLKCGAGVSTMMRKAVDAGLLLAEKQGAFMAYRLPDPAPEPGGPLGITTWDDGDVVVSGAQIGDDGQVIFTRSQIEQLVRQVTQPHVRLMGVGHHPV